MKLNNKTQAKKQKIKICPHYDDPASACEDSGLVYFLVGRNHRKKKNKNQYAVLEEIPQEIQLLLGFLGADWGKFFYGLATYESAQHAIDLFAGAVI